MQKIMGTEWAWLFFLIFTFGGDPNFKTIYTALVFKSLFKQKYWAKIILVKTLIEGQSFILTGFKAEN